MRVERSSADIAALRQSVRCKPLRLGFRSKRSGRPDINTPGPFWISERHIPAIDTRASVTIRHMHSQIVKVAHRVSATCAVLFSREFVGEQFQKDLSLLRVGFFCQAFPVMSDVLFADELAENVSRLLR